MREKRQQFPFLPVSPPSPADYSPPFPPSRAGPSRHSGVPAAEAGGGGKRGGVGPLQVRWGGQVGMEPGDEREERLPVRRGTGGEAGVEEGERLMRFHLYDLLGMLPVDPATPAPHTSTHAGLGVGPAGNLRLHHLKHYAPTPSTLAHFQARAALAAGPTDGPPVPPPRLRPHLAAATGGGGRRAGGCCCRRRRRRVPAGATAGCACRPATSRSLGGGGGEGGAGKRERREGG